MNVCFSGVGFGSGYLKFPLSLWRRSSRQTSSLPDLQHNPAIPSGAIKQRFGFPHFGQVRSRVAIGHLSPPDRLAFVSWISRDCAAIVSNFDPLNGCILWPVRAAVFI
jgi:hypothetical protein